jgi:DNA invertase Pin-like site-specific DNA recombinase
MIRRAPTTKPSRAVGYVRISVDRDNETSTESQEERIRAYCAAHGWGVVDLIVEPGRSAFKATRTSRPGFRRVMDLVRTGAADVLVVWKIDRAARDLRDMLDLVDELKEHGVRFVSVTESFDTSTASGRMLMQVLGSLAEMESATKSERIQAWQEQRRTNGATPTGPRPYGYRRERNRLHIDPAEAEVIREAADRVLARQSLGSIVADLEQRGVKGKNGTPLTDRALRKILIGPSIAACREVEPGVFVESTEWKPILTRKRWDRVRAFLTDPARRSGPGPGRRWLLTGIAACSRCKGDDGEPVKMRAKSPRSGREKRYTCPSCFLSIEVARTDEVVERDLLSMLDPKAWRRLRQGRPATVDSSGFEEAMQALTQRFIGGDIDATELAELAEALRLQQEVDATPPPQLPDVPDLAKAWPKLSLEQRRLVLTAATQSLTIQPWTPTRYFDPGRIVWTPVA